MKPTEELVHEHEVITLVLDAAQDEAARMRETRRARSDFMEKLIDFFRNFTDGCHHAKEEKHLFPLLESKGMPHGMGAIAVLLAEHEEGRRKVSAMNASLPEAAQGNESAVLNIRENLETYVQLIREHIGKENNVLFPAADRMLSDDDQEELAAEFAEVEEKETGEGVHERYHRLAHDLSRSAGV